MLLLIQGVQLIILVMMELILILEHLALESEVNLITFLQKVVEVVEKEPPMEEEMVVQAVVQVAATQVQ